MTIHTDFKHNVMLGVTSVRVTSPFGKRILNGIPGFHYGIDLVPYPYQQAKLIAYQTGKVKEISSSLTSGNYIVLLHDDNTTTIHKHIATGSINQKVGDIVEIGEVVGIMGKTGMVTGVHDHFEIRIGNTAVDPLPYLQGLKDIKPYKEITYIMNRPELPMLNVFATSLNYRDKPNGAKLGVLPIGDYAYLGKTQIINGYEWAEIILKEDEIVWCALNPAWNKVVMPAPKPITLKAEMDKDGHHIVVDITPITK